MKKRKMNKTRAQSQIISTVLLILLVLAAIIIVWNVVNSLIKKSSGEISNTVDIFSIEYSAEKIIVDKFSNVQVKVKNKKGDNVNKLIFTFYSSDGNVKTIERTKADNDLELPKELETKLFTFYDLGLQSINKITITPVLGDKAGIEVNVDGGEIKSTDTSILLDDLTKNYGLIAWWKFEEGNTLAKDFVKGNDGGLKNGVNCNVNGKYGKACDFDGVDDYVIGNSLLGISGNAEFTMCAWITGTSWVSNYPSFMGIDRTGTNNGLSFTVRDGRPAIDFWNNRWRSTDVLSLNTWHHVCGTKKPGLISATSTIYIDGTKVNGNTEGTDSLPNILDAKPVIGRLDSTRYFKGLIDEVMVFNHALTDSEVKKIYELDLSKA